MPKVDTGVVVRFGADGEYEVKQMNLTNGWQLFQAALAIYHATSQELAIGNVPAHHQYDNQPIRENIAKRVQYIQQHHADQMPLLQANWIASLPRLTSDEPIHRHQLAILERVLSVVEGETSAPFDPPPTQELPRQETTTAETTTARDPELPVSETEIENLKSLINTAPREVKQAIKDTAAEATKAKATLSLQGKPDLRRVVIASLMLDIYIADCTNNREYMRTLLRHHNHDHTDIGATLGRLTLSQISQIGETHAQVQQNTLCMDYNATTDSFSIIESKQ
jgi:hypothetical protein